MPSVEVEDHRHFHRELTDLKEQRTQHTNRIKGYLANQGICLDGNDDFPEIVEQQHLWNGETLPHGLRARLLCEYQRRCGKGSKRLHKIGIVALARKLLIAIWRYPEFGTLQSTCSDWPPASSSAIVARLV